MRESVLIVRDDSLFLSHDHAQLSISEKSAQSEEIYMKTINAKV